MWYLIVSIPDLCNLTYYDLINCVGGGCGGDSGGGEVVVVVSDRMICAFQ